MYQTLPLVPTPVYKVFQPQVLVYPRKVQHRGWHLEIAASPPLLFFLTS